MSPTTTAPGFVDSLQTRGRYTFRKDEIRTALGATDAAIEQALRRLATKRRVARIRKGFYVIVPLEHQARGVLPPSWFIHDLMGFLGAPYYVGLLSAAEIHGAAHQAPQEFQVMTTAPRRVFVAGNVRIRLVQTCSLPEVPTVPSRVPTGDIPVSTPEATAIDLVVHSHYCGGLSNVATVLSELSEHFASGKLVALARSVRGYSRVHWQRLGYLLDCVQVTAAADELAAWMDGQRIQVTPLRPDLPWQGAPRANRWYVAVNDTVEPDL